MMIRKIRMGYKKNGRYIRSDYVMEDAIDSYVKTFAHTDKELDIHDNGLPSYENKNGTGSLLVWTNNGYETITVD